MPIILYVVASWLMVAGIIGWFVGGLGSVAPTVAFVGAWMLVAMSGVMSRIDAVNRALGTDVRAVPLKKKKPTGEGAAGGEDAKIKAEGKAAGKVEGTAEGSAEAGAEGKAKGGEGGTAEGPAQGE